MRKALALLLVLLSSLVTPTARAVPVQAWSGVYNAGAYDYFGGAAVDGLGNLYVAGSKQTNLVTDLVLLKYSANGTLVWSRVYNGPSGGADQASSIAVDPAGNIWIGGNTQSGTQTDAVLLKYSPAGALLLTRTFTSPDFSQESFSRMAIDSAGAVYVTTPLTRSASASDTMVRKYTNAGAVVWTFYYTSPGKVTDSPTAILLDAARNPYVAIHVNSSPRKVIIYKLKSATGAVAFVKVQGAANGGTEFGSMAMDSAGNLLATFLESYGEAQKRVAIVKWSGSTGSVFMPFKYYAAATTPDFYYAPSVATGPGGVFSVLVGLAKVEGFFNFFFEYRLLSYSAAGVLLKTNVLSPATQKAVGPAGMIQDSSGNVYIYAALGTPRFMKLWKYSAAGAKIWEFLPTRPAGKVPSPQQLVRKATGELYLAGIEYPSAADQKGDFLSAKITGG